MMTEFLSCLLGRWSNKDQAFSNPTRYSWILSSWDDVGEGKILSKQWYHYMGEDKPYREKIKTFIETESGILAQTWDIDGTRNNLCDMHITLSKGVWIGKNLGTECIINGATLRSEFELQPGQFLTRDAGFIDDKLVWGSLDYYHFGRLAQR